MTTTNDTTATHRPPYRVVVLNADNTVKRTLYRSQHFAAVLGFLSRNIDARPSLDIIRGDRFVEWELEPRLLGVVVPAGVKR